MMVILNILAKDSDSDSSIKFIFGAIVVVIWIVGVVMAQMKKKADRERWNNPQPQQDWSHLLRDLTAGQSKPYNPSTPAPPPIITPQDPRYQPMQRQAPPQIKSFAQQSPRPFVQQYRPPQAQMRPRARSPQRTIQPPKPVQPRPKTQRRPPPVPAQAIAVPTPPEAQVGLIQDATITMGQAGGATSVTTSTARSGAPRVTRAQLRKLILWSEILSPPLSLR